MNGVLCPACQRPATALYQTDFNGHPWFYQCGIDGHCFVSPEPTPHELQELYGEKYTNNESWLKKNRDCAKDYWTKITPLLPKGRFNFLEIGGAYGYLSSLVAKNTSAEVTMIEAGESASKYAREQLGIKVSQCMLEDFSPTEEYDIIFAGHVIEHVIHLDLFIESCRKLLKPGGKLILLTPNSRAWKFRLSGRKWGWAAPEQHTLFFSNASASKIFPHAGLGVELIRTTVPTLANYPYAWVRHLSEIFTRRFGRAASTTHITPISDGEASQPRPSRFARFRVIGRPLVWLEYALLSFADRVIFLGRSSDELMIVVSNRPKI